MRRILTLYDLWWLHTSGHMAHKHIHIYVHVRNYMCVYVYICTHVHTLMEVQNFEFCVLKRNPSYIFKMNKGWAV